MKKLGLKENELNQIVSIGVGGYIRKTDVKKFNKMFEKRKQEFKNAIRSDLTGKGFIKQMFRYELAKNEYCFTRDLTDTLEALYLTMEDINSSKALKNGLKIAESEYLKACRKPNHTEDEEFEI